MREFYLGTSNSVAFKMNYHFDEKELSIESPTTESSTHKNNIRIWEIPKWDLHFYIDGTVSKRLDQGIRANITGA